MDKRKIIIVSIIITILVFSTVFFFIAKSYKKGEIAYNFSNETINDSTLKNNIVSNELLQTSSSENTKVSPTAKIKMTQYYEECGHVVNEEFNVPMVVVNMSEDKVKEYYKGWEVKFFSPEEIKLYKLNNGVCNEHYIVKDVNGYINIFVKNKQGEEVNYKATDILSKYLSEEDRACLENGISVVGKDNLEALIQDFE